MQEKNNGRMPEAKVALPVTETTSISSSLASVDLNLLVSLEAILLEESVTGAADRVGLSQPAMSHTLRRLRRLFGDELLVRQSGHSTLTPRAQQLRGPLRDVLRRTEGLFKPSGFDPISDTREVTIAMNPGIATVLGASLVRIMSREAPEMTLRAATTMDLKDSLLTLGVDALLLSEAYSTEYERQRLYDDEWVVIAGQTGLAASEWLAERHHVLYESQRPQPPYEALRQEGIKWNAHTRVTDSLMIPHLVAGTDCVGVHRRSIMTAMVQNLPLWMESFPFDVPGLSIDVVWNPWSHDTEFRRWFRSILERAAAEHLPPSSIHFMNAEHDKHSLADRRPL
ncbi:LysR family transcriptional regulator [Arthrobacter pigmenti]